ncbi:hypothetical protein HA402_012395 [Bradysia odoriphaga]|nr:hypothetical protein HA402_012395 [Bradysia odoriphaga]
MAYVQRFIDAGKRYFVAICAIITTQILCAVTRLDRVANPDKYRIELPVDQEATFSDSTTQTENDSYLEFVNLPSYPIQYKATLPDTLKSLIGNKSRSDVTFCIDNEYVAAHRLILAARSDVFDTMLYGFANANRDIVYIEDISMDIFHLLLSYIYTNHVDLSHDNVIEILYAAHKYNLSFLEDRCENFIKSHKTYGNVLATINQLFQYSAFETIKSKLLQFVCDNFYENFTKVDCLVQIDSIDLIKLLLEKLLISDHKPDHGRFEFDLFHMLIHWAKMKTNVSYGSAGIKWDKVRSCLEGAEQLINFENMNAELLNKCVAANPGFFTKDEICNFFTRENLHADSQYQRNNSSFEVCNEGEGFVIFRADPKLMSRQFKAIIPSATFKPFGALVEQIEE